MQRADAAAARAQVQRVFHALGQPLSGIGLHVACLALKGVLVQIGGNGGVDLFVRHRPQLLRRIDLHQLAMHRAVAARERPARRGQIAAADAVGYETRARGSGQLARGSKDRPGYARVGAVPLGEQADVRSIFEAAQNLQRGARIRHALAA